MVNYFYSIIDPYGKFVVGYFVSVKHARNYCWQIIMDDNPSPLLSLLKGNQARIKREHMTTGKVTYFDI